MRRYLLLPMLLLATIANAQNPDSAKARMLRQAGPVAGNKITINNLHPLFVLDGVISDSTAIGKLQPRDILSVTVLKNAGAKALYGEQGKDGVVLISTRAFVQQHIYSALSPYSQKFKEIGTCGDCLVYIHNNEIIKDVAKLKYMQELEHAKIESVTVIEQPALEQQYKVSDKKYGVIAIYQTK